MTRLLTALGAALFAATAYASPSPIQFVKDVNPTVGVDTSGRVNPVSLGTGSLLTLCGGNGLSTTCNPWITDGTAAGTHVVKRLATSPVDRFGSYTTIGGAGYFLQANDAGATLWRTDGSAAGTTPLINTAFLWSTLAATSSHVYFVGGQDQRIWRSDGTVAGTTTFTSLRSQGIAASGDQLFFSCDDGTTGMELCMSDGTEAGTVLVRDIAPGTAGSYPRNFTVIGGHVFFLAQDSLNRTQVWASDGTASGTVLLADGMSQVGHFEALGGRAFFLALNAASGTSYLQLWSSDGTGVGTMLVDQKQTTYFYDSLATQGAYAWYALDTLPRVSDGTPGGTSGIPDAPSIFSQFVTVGQDLYFASAPLVASTIENQRSIWKIRASDHAFVTVLPSADFYPVAALGDRLLMYASMNAAAWTIDAAGNAAPLPTAPGQPSSGSWCNGGNVAHLGGFMLYPANDGTHGCELWRTDGTDAGTLLVKDISPAIDHGSLQTVSYFVVAGPFAYFPVRMYDGHFELWRSDGTPDGTTMVWNLGQGAISMIAAGGTLFFEDDANRVRAINAASSTPVMVFDGPALGYSTVVLDGASGSKVLIAALSASGSPLFVLDGTEGGRVPILFQAAPTPFAPSVALGDVMLYQFFSGSLAGLWRTDFTPEGTYQLVAANGGGTLAPVGAVGNVAFFLANSTLYRTDGTHQGTVAVSTSTIFSSTAPPVSVVATPQALWFNGTVGTKTGLYRVTPYDVAPQLITKPELWQKTVPVGPLGAFFIDRTAATGSELWMVNGAGTPATLVDDFQTGAASSDFLNSGIGPQVVGDYLLLQSSRDETGFEMYRVPLSALPGASPPTAAMRKVDFDGDGSADLVLERADGTVEIRLMHGTAAGASAIVTPSAPGHVITTTGDFNGDGKADLLFRRNDGLVEMWLMDGTSRVQVSTLAPAGSPWHPIHVADFDGDGKSDIVWASTDGSVGLWLMNGANSTQRETLLPAATPWVATHVGDFNGDGRADLLWRHADGSVSLWTMMGMAIVDHAPFFGPGTSWSALQTADFDGDGKTDILWQATDGSVSMWMMNGGAIASRAPLMGPNTNWTVTHAADFNADGKADLMWLARDGSAGMWLMNGAAALDKKTVMTAGLGWLLNSAPDLNGDGKSDLVWVHSSGGVGAWLMDGTTNTARAPLEPPGSTNRVVPLQFHH